jgi:hypothetical protein
VNSRPRSPDKHRRQNVRPSTAYPPPTTWLQARRYWRPLPESVLRRLPPLTIAMSAYLLFSVEPIVGKVTLPWFGGAADVWTACLAFFQTALLLGYLYARLIAHRAPALQLRIHGTLLLASLALLPILPGPHWKPYGPEHPLLGIVVMLTATVGLPFVLLSSTTPLVQSWLAPAGGDRWSPYRLFALSNLASFLALVSYPVIVEPMTTVRTQGLSWSYLYAGFVLLALVTSRYLLKAPRQRFATVTASTSAGVAERVLWVGLSAVPSALLLTVTSYMLRNIAPIPLLWIIPLGLYLLSLTLSFGWSRWYVRPVWYALFLLSVYAMSMPVGTAYLFDNYRSLLFLYSVGLFICCCVCHGELVALRPAPHHLTDFYLMTALGGAGGALLIAVVAPAVLDTAAHDLPAVLGLALCLVIVAAWRRFCSLQLRWRLSATSVCLALAAVWGLHYVRMATDPDGGVVLVSKRTFFGWLTVVEQPAQPSFEQTRDLLNGSISHGRQFTDDTRRKEPLTYYTPESGIGVTLRELGQQHAPLRVGVVGLGAGTLAAYGRRGDTYRFYELDPAVTAIAEGYFSYLSRSEATWEVIEGDARLSLEREASQQFDVLAVDAFTSDAVPSHLLTREAFAVYWRHLRRDGVLAIHVTNRYLELADVVAAVAPAFDKTAKLFVDKRQSDSVGFSSEWVLVTSRTGFFSEPALQPAVNLASDPSKGWSDDYSSVWTQVR